MNLDFAVTNGKPPRRVLVVGGTGRLGRLVTQHFHDRGCHVRVASRSPRLAADCFRGLQRVEIIDADLGAPSSLSGIAANCDVTVFAAGARRPCYAESRDDMEEFQRINVRGLRAVGESVLRAGNQPLLHLGSLFALGVERHGVLSEDSEARPKTPFELSEFEGEQALRELHAKAGLDCRILRLPPVAGATPRGGLLDSIRVAGLDAEWRNVFEMNSDKRKPLISPSDFLSGLDHSLAFGEPGRCYHLSSGDFTLAEMWRGLAAGGSRIPTLSHFLDGHVERFQSLTRFLRIYLKWDVCVNLNTAAAELDWRPKSRACEDLWTASTYGQSALQTNGDPDGVQ